MEKTDKVDMGASANIPPVSVFVSIGSNTAQKHKNVAEVIETLKSCFTVKGISSVYETPCYRREGEQYVNAVCLIETPLDLASLERMFKEMETKAGRIHSPEMKNIVPLDIDVVVFDSRIIRERDFSRLYFRKGYSELTDPRNIGIGEYDYELPDDRIARHPLKERDRCKLLVCDHGKIIDTEFYRIGDFLPSDTLFVCNNTRVINARLRFVKDSGASIEIFCLEPVYPGDYQMNFSSFGPVMWKCLVGNSKRWKSGLLSSKLTVSGQEIVLTAERVNKDGSESEIKFSWDSPHISFSEIIAAAGVIPIPPYLNRETEESDKEDYQTVYNKVEGSVAAPTAGLHFTNKLIAELEEKGMRWRSVTLHVGAGTFRPVTSEKVGEHVMHSEFIEVSRNLIEEIIKSGRPITAVGTTSVRTLESLYHIGCKIATGKWDGSLDQWYPYDETHPHLPAGEALRAIVDYLDENRMDKLITSTQIIIAPGYRYRLVRNLVTNFHQPGSTLLLLIAAIVGERWKEIYDYALANGYRFLSYGDACLFKDIDS